MAVAKMIAADFISAVLPGQNGNPDKKGWKFCGAWINGSEKYETVKDIMAACTEHELYPSKSGKSLILNDGSFQPMDTARLALFIKPRAVIEFSDLNDLI